MIDYDWEAEPWRKKTWVEMSLKERWLCMWWEIGLSAFFMGCHGKIPEKTVAASSG